MKLVLANEATAARRRCYFHLVDATDGITAETGEAAGQPQVSSDGGAFTNTGIGTLTHIGNGRYYADLTQALVATAGTQIETRYKSANTAESPGDSFQVVAFDPYDAVRIGLTALPNAAADAAGGLPISDAGGLDLDGVLSGNVPQGADNNTILSSLTIADGAVDAKITYIMDTILTEGGAGRLAAAFIKLFDVATPLLVASDVMRGTDGANTVVPDAAGTAPTAAENADAVWDEAIAGHVAAGSFGAKNQKVVPSETIGDYKADVSTLATAAKLLAYVQLLARSDAAIATDNATELTEINADGGSGIGDYSNQTEANEGIRDRGDTAWITGAGGDATEAKQDTILAKMLAYFRLALRSDAGPTTDDATELTAINADSGSGAGDYVAGDSQEGIRDRGDSAWTTGGGNTVNSTVSSEPVQVTS